ncbi:envelope stress response membrane protein PspB [Pseudaeromonas sharmana]|uniref:Envelope stress response membrane protein PspB n=1 Tax=Pseudaeromonas sharmana TaxID=328412 RepID=A0ABV8CPW3_9GAMM
MSMLAGLLVIPAILFVLFVAPIWLFLHYRSGRQVEQGLSDQERARLKALLAQAELLQERVHTLERLLDVEVPEWRDDESLSGDKS